MSRWCPSSPSADMRRTRRFFFSRSVPRMSATDLLFANLAGFAIVVSAARAPSDAPPTAAPDAPTAAPLLPAAPAGAAGRIGGGPGAGGVGGAGGPSIAQVKFEPGVVADIDAPETSETGEQVLIAVPGQVSQAGT